MSVQQINRVSGKIILVLSLVAMLTVLTGYFQPPQPDEGSAAHIFQLSIAALVPKVLLFLGTADWKHPSRSVPPLLLPGVTLAVTFSALFYLEHYFDLARR